jgi:hypothetical protein
MLCSDLNVSFSVLTQKEYVEEITNFQYSECKQKLERVYCKALNISRGKKRKTQNKNSNIPILNAWFL